MIRRRPPSTVENRLHAQVHDLRPEAAARVAELAALRPDEAVLEVGAGTGELTARLLLAGARVWAVERDPARTAALRARLGDGAGRLRVAEGDATRLHPELPVAWRVVANPPFNLTAILVRRWLLALHPGSPARAIDLVLQRQAAEKLCGGEFGHTRSSVLVALAGRGYVAATLPRAATLPPSRVDLAVWGFRRGVEAPPIAELRRVDALLERAFAGPRTLAEALRGLATSMQLRRQGAEHGYHPDVHPRALAPRAWWSLARLLAQCGKLA